MGVPALLPAAGPVATLGSQCVALTTTSSVTFYLVSFLVGTAWVLTVAAYTYAVARVTKWWYKVGVESRGVHICGCKGHKVVTVRSVACQAQTTYTMKSLQPRFRPLPESSHGVDFAPISEVRGVGSCQ